MKVTTAATQLNLGGQLAVKISSAGHEKIVRFGKGEVLGNRLNGVLGVIDFYAAQPDLT